MVYKNFKLPKPTFKTKTYGGWVRLPREITFIMGAEMMDTVDKLIAEKLSEEMMKGQAFGL